MIDEVASSQRFGAGSIFGWLCAGADKTRSFLQSGRGQRLRLLKRKPDGRRSCRARRRGCRLGRLPSGKLWASNVDFGDETDAEIDLYGGYRTEAAGYAVEFGAGGYAYVGAPTGSDYNYMEFKAMVSRTVGAATLAPPSITRSTISGAMTRRPMWKRTSSSSRRIAGPCQAR